MLNHFDIWYPVSSLLRYPKTIGDRHPQSSFGSFPGGFGSLALRVTPSNGVLFPLRQEFGVSPQRRMSQDVAGSEKPRIPNNSVPKSTLTWGCPKSWGCPILIIHFRLGFSLDHPAIGVPPWPWKAPYHFIFIKLTFI